MPRTTSIIFTAPGLLAPGPGETPEQKTLREQLAKGFAAAFGCRALDEDCAMKLTGMLEKQKEAVDAPFQKFGTRAQALTDCLSSAACSGIPAADREAFQRLLMGPDAAAIGRPIRVLEHLNANGGLGTADSYVCSPAAVANPETVNLSFCTDAFSARELGVPKGF